MIEEGGGDNALLITPKFVHVNRFEGLSDKDAEKSINLLSLNSLYFSII